MYLILEGGSHVKLLWMCWIKVHISDIWSDPAIWLQVPWFGNATLSFRILQYEYLCIRFMHQIIKDGTCSYPIPKSVFVALFLLTVKELGYWAQVQCVWVKWQVAKESVSHRLMCLKGLCVPLLVRGKKIPPPLYRIEQDALFCLCFILWTFIGSDFCCGHNWH